MIYRARVDLTLNTRTNKVVIEKEGKRIAIFPGKKLAEHWTDVTVNDRPIAAVSHAKDLCKIMVRELMGKRQVKRILKTSNETTDGG